MAHHNDVYKANVLKLEAEFFKLRKIFNNSKLCAMGCMDSTCMTFIFEFISCTLSLTFSLVYF